MIHGVKGVFKGANLAKNDIRNIGDLRIDILRTKKDIDMRFSLKGGNYQSAFFFIRIEWAVHQVRPQNFKITRTESDIDMRFSLKGSPRPTISYSRYSRPWVATTIVPLFSYKN